MLAFNNQRVIRIEWAGRLLVYFFHQDGIHLEDQAMADPAMAQSLQYAHQPEITVNTVQAGSIGTNREVTRAAWGCPFFWLSCLPFLSHIAARNMGEIH